MLLVRTKYVCAILQCKEGLLQRVHTNQCVCARANLRLSQPAIFLSIHSLNKIDGAPTMCWAGGDVVANREVRILPTLYL